MSKRVRTKPTSTGHPSKLLKQSSLGSFITGIRESPPEALYPSKKVEWELLHDSVLFAKYESPSHDSYSEVPMNKMAAFDFDNTIASVNGSHVFPKNGDDWKWFHEHVPQVLLHLGEIGYSIVIFTNQKNILKTEKRNLNAKAAFLGRIDRTLEALESLANEQGKNIPSIHIFAATEDDFFRKPRPGMWYLLKSMYPNVSLDYTHSFYCGDAAGRPNGWHQATFKRDHSDADRKWAINAGVKFFVPEHVFHHSDLHDALSRTAQSSEDWIQLIKLNSSSFPKLPELPHFSKYASRSQNHPCTQLSPNLNPNSRPHLVLLVGSPASGKSSLCRRFFSQGWTRINQDTQGTKAKCLKSAREALASGQSVIVDNTNPDPASRKVYLDLASEVSATPLALFLETESALCQHNNAFRQHKLHALEMLQLLDTNLPVLQDDQEKRNQERDQQEHHQVVPPVAFHSYHSRFVPPSVQEGFSQVLSVPFEPHFESQLDKFLWNFFWH